MWNRLRTWLRRADRAFAIGAGVLYGIMAQLVARKVSAVAAVFVVMSFGYVFLLPFCIGVVTSFSRTGKRTLGNALGLSFGTACLCLGVAFLVGWEGSICLIMAAPIYLPLAMLGGVLGHFAQRTRRFDETRSLVLGPLLLLPMLSALAEQRLALSPELHVVENAIDIEASEQTVFAHIARVRPITEPQESLFFSMGFPKPVEATLSHEGVGGVRHASFERGLFFVETVTVFQPPEALRFQIEVDPGHTPLTTLDGHVTVGGAFFDVLEGGYRVQRLESGRVRLHLDSRHRISTHYNFYTALWSEYLMSEIQENILRVIKQRAERAERATVMR